MRRLVQATVPAAPVAPIPIPLSLRTGATPTRLLSAPSQYYEDGFPSKGISRVNHHPACRLKTRPKLSAQQLERPLWRFQRAPHRPKCPVTITTELRFRSTVTRLWSLTWRRLPTGTHLRLRSTIMRLQHTGGSTIIIVTPGSAYTAPPVASGYATQPIYDYAPGYGYEYTPGYWNRGYWGRWRAGWWR